MQTRLEYCLRGAILYLECAHTHPHAVYIPNATGTHVCTHHRPAEQRRVLPHGPSRLLLQAAWSAVVVVVARGGGVTAARVERVCLLEEGTVLVLHHLNVSPSAAPPECHAVVRGERKGGEGGREEERQERVFTNATGVPSSTGARTSRLVEGQRGHGST